MIPIFDPYLGFLHYKTKGEFYAKRRKNRTVGRHYHVPTLCIGCPIIRNASILENGSNVHFIHKGQITT